MAFFVGSFMLVPFLPTGFLPPDDLSQTQVTITLPPGSVYAETRDVAEQARVIVARNQYVKKVYTAIGGGMAGGDPFMSGGASEARKATLTLNRLLKAFITFKNGTTKTEWKLTIWLA